MKNTKPIFVKLSLLVCLLFFSCEASSAYDKNDLRNTMSQIEVSKVVTHNGRSFLALSDTPYPIFGAQIRLDAFLFCDKMSVEEIEKYIAKAKELNVNTVEIGITWSMVETKRDSYDFSIVDRILSYVNKYGLKMELLWFGSNFCGDSFTYHIPQYALSDYDTKLYRNDEGSFWNYYGYQYTLVMDDQGVMEREGKALSNLMNHIRRWDAQNGNMHPVISVQIENEPDCLVRWRIDQKNIQLRDGSPLTKQRGWQMTLNSLDYMGGVVKNSSYKVATRCNIVFGNGVEAFAEAPNASPRDVFNLKNIDFIGTDSYKNRVGDIVKEVKSYASLAGNYSHVAENKGSYWNTPSLILAAAALGGGYAIYDLATSLFFINNTGLSFEEIDHGIYTYDLKDRPHTPQTRSILKGLTDGYVDVAKFRLGDFAAFNIDQDFPQSSNNQTIKTSGAEIKFETSTGAIGFVVDMQSYLLVYATGNSTFTFGNGVFAQVVTGSYDGSGEFVNDGTATLTSNRLNASGGVLYKVSYTSSGALESNIEDFICKI